MIDKPITNACLISYYNQRNCCTLGCPDTDGKGEWRFYGHLGSYRLGWDEVFTTASKYRYYREKDLLGTINTSCLIMTLGKWGSTCNNRCLPHLFPHGSKNVPPVFSGKFSQVRLLKFTKGRLWGSGNYCITHNTSP